ncbi:choice-of-anchor Q domain-containing protein, partial [Gimesia sp.]|uniref:choice-of-anchor Q domain-containing protein n=1 Tax=Gimesia sp. TaxID=2024833 RepID=UPI0032F0128B
MAETLEDRTLLTAFTVLNTNDSGAGSLRDAIEQANANEGADTITFDASLAGQSVVLTDELVISDDLTITGLGADQLNLDGDSDGRIFNVDDRDDLTAITVAISELTLSNGSAETGGAIYNAETLTLMGVNLTGNTSTRYNGAGIYNDGGNLTLGHSYFFGNMTLGGGTLGDGGGIYQSGGSLTIADSEFAGNKADYTGGGIYVSEASNVSITNTIFRSNIARSGGAIRIDLCPFTIRNCVFTENRATDLHGGAIYYYANSYKSVVEDCQFTDNYAGGFGGAVHSFHKQKWYTLEIKTSTFIHNIADADGGAINTLGELIIQECSFYRNVSDESGGAVLCSNTLLISGSTFAENDAGFQGGALSSRGDSLKVYNSTFSENSSYTSGGAISASFTSFVSIVNCTVVSNIANNGGGGISVNQLSFGDEFILSNSILAGNVSGEINGSAFRSNTGSNNILNRSLEGLVDPELRDNGGPTQTHALLFGSSAIDAGNKYAASTARIGIITNDQRGSGYQRVVGENIDIGAYEFRLTQIDFRIVNRETLTSGNGERTVLNENLGSIDEWGDFWLDIWISSPSPAPDLGILSASFDLNYDTTIITATAIEYGSAFTIKQSGTLNDQIGVVENLSAETVLTAVGAERYVLFARIHFESTADDEVDLDLANQNLNPQTPTFFIENSNILFSDGTESDEVQGVDPATQIYANPYDLNDDGAINFNDLLRFAAVYQQKPSESSSDYAWFADYNQDDRVSFQDLLLFASNYGKRKSGPELVTYPENYPDAWNQLLTVAPAPPPSQTATTIQQTTAESLLGATVAEISPQLSPAQQQTLSEIDIKVVDLADETLGRAAAGTIYIDVNAAGYGWFIDTTPAEHSEFSPASDLTLIAL